MTALKKTMTNKVSNDPVSDFLTRLRNATMVNKASVLIPYSKLKEELAKLLQREGYILGYQIVNDEKPSTKSLEISIKYAKGKPVIHGSKKYSKPGLRKYTKGKYAPRVLSGLGVSILTTSQGLMTDRVARKQGIGGEILCQVW